MSEIIQILPNPWRGVRPFERHSLVLLVAGGVYLLVGGAFIFTPMTPARQEALAFALQVLSMTQWGLVFALAGLLSIISSRWPPVSETWGYIVLTGLSAGWAAFYGVGVLFGEAPVSNFTGTLTWGLLGFMWWAISGLVNPQALVAMAKEISMLQQENLALHNELARARQKEE